MIFFIYIKKNILKYNINFINVKYSIIRFGKIFKIFVLIFCKQFCKNKYTKLSIPKYSKLSVIRVIGRVIIHG